MAAALACSASTATPTLVSATSQAVSGKAIATLPTDQYGYNTTSSGGNLFRFTPTLVTTLTDFVVQFNFQNAIQAFGTFVTGMQQDNGSLFLQFNDGTSQSFSFTGNPTAMGGIQFIGFATTALVTRVEFRLNAITLSSNGTGFRDIMAFDDIRLGMLAGRRRRRRFS